MAEASSAPATRVKVAILGGGTAALTAAYYLATQSDPTKKYDITVYQLGWRLGGKGASGRNRCVADRIEEHGLHVWSGFYENAFMLMRDAYPKLNRVPGRDPLAVVFPDPKHPNYSPAFRPHSLVVIEEFYDSRWIQWAQQLPDNNLLPGNGKPMSLWDLFKVALEWLAKFVKGLLGLGLIERAAGKLLPDWVENLVREFEADIDDSSTWRLIRSVAATWHRLMRRLGPPRRLEHTFATLASELVENLTPPDTHPAEQLQSIEWLIDEFLQWLAGRIDETLLKNDALRRQFILIDLIGSIIRGAIRDGVLVYGTTVINKYDLIEWLKRHGAHEITLGSALVRGFYDYCFAFEQGDPNRPRMAAGDGLLHLARLTMDVKGAIFWKMQAGMGDTVFTPLYLLLRNLGVKFEYFNEVRELKLATDGRSVERIDLRVQATVTDAAKSEVHTLGGHNYTGEYWPLFDVGGLPCWPSEPIFGDLVEGPALQERGIDLENPWADWSGVGSKTLTRGTDFDVVVLGVSHGPLKYLTPELSAASPDWKAMVEQIKTTQTVGVQLWCTPTWKQLGWQYGTPLVTAYAQSIQTWGDFSQVLPRESWPAPLAPGSVSYLCGNLQDLEEIPDFSDHDFPRRQHERLMHYAEQWLTDNAAVVWPAGGLRSNPASLDWRHLVDLNDGQGIARFRAQWFRANVSPSERYVLTVPGDMRFRMKKGRTPFSNLFVAGDCTFTGILGSIEGSVMSGMMASRAICGSPTKVYGEVEPTEE